METDTEDYQSPSLSDLLKGKDDASAPVAEVVTQETATVPEAVAPVDEPKGDDPATPAGNERTVPLSALEKVRKEAQEAKARIAELEARYAQGQQPRQEQPQAQQPDPMLDPDGYRALIAWETKVATSTALLKSQKTDYDDVVQVYMEAATRGEVPRIPSDHPSPAQFAYDQGKRIQKLNEFGDLDTVEQRLRAKWEAELANVAAKAKAEADAKRDAQIMPTTAGDRSAAPSKTEGWSGPKPLEQLLKKRK